MWAAQPRPTLPVGVEEVESLAPLPVSVVSGPEEAIGRLFSLSGIRSVTTPPSEALAITRGIARVLLSVEELTATAVNGYPGRLPLGAGAHGAIPAYPVLGDNPAYLVDTDTEVRRIAPMCHPAAVNLSLETPAWLGEELPATDPLAVAVAEAARRAPVVVAVGNEGRRRAADTRSALARLPTTLAVGATADEEGTTLDQRSATGPVGGEGPFVCAWARSIHERPRRGTSFAAPRVTRELGVLTGFLLTLCHAAADRGMEGIPLCGVAVVDEGPLQHADSRLPISAYPIAAGVDPDAVRTAAEVARAAGVTLEFRVTNQAVLTALARSARAMQGHEPHQVGHGFVSEQTTLDYLRGFDGHELVQVLLPLNRDHRVVADAALDIVLTTPELERAACVWARGALWVYWDYRGRAGAVA